MTDGRRRWLDEADADEPRAQLLAAAGEVFARRGTSAAMSAVASAAGCSRATLYRYFPTRRDLHLGYVEWSAQRIGVTVRALTSDLDDPRQAVTESVIITLRQVRADPVMSAWFSPDEAGVAARLALDSRVIEALANNLLAGDSRISGDDHDDTDLAAQWVVRAVVSMLTIPSDPDTERALVETYLTPAVLGQSPVGPILPVDPSRA